MRRVFHDVLDKICTCVGIDTVDLMRGDKMACFQIARFSRLILPLPTMRERLNDEIK